MTVPQGQVQLQLVPVSHGQQPGQSVAWLALHMPGTIIHCDLIPDRAYHLVLGALPASPEQDLHFFLPRPIVSDQPSAGYIASTAILFTYCYSSLTARALPAGWHWHSGQLAVPGSVYRCK